MTLQQYQHSLHCTSVHALHTREAISDTDTARAPKVTPCGSHLTASNSASCSAALLPASSTLQLTPLLVLDHADIAMALGQKSSEAGYQRLLDELLLLVAYPTMLRIHQYYVAHSSP